MLPIAKYPAYLSPSSLMAFEGRPNTFYLQRMAPDPIPYDPQGPAAAVGSAFDAYIKMVWLQEAFGLNSEVYLKHLEVVRQRLFEGMYSDEQKNKYRTEMTHDVMFLSSVEEQHRDEAARQGRELCKIYKSNVNTLKYLRDIEIHRRFVLLPESVPLFMKLDATCIDFLNEKPNPDKVYPFDWKVMGYGSNSGVSPKKGYALLFDNGVLKPGHKDYVYDIPAEQVDSKWAIQLATYGWGLGHPIGEPFPAYIDAIIIRPNKIRVARYRMLISKEFQLDLKDRYVRAWKAIKSGSFIKSLNTTERNLVYMNAQQENWWD